MSLEMRVLALFMLPSVFGILGLLLQFCLFFIFFKSLLEVKGYADKTGCSRHIGWDGVDTSDVVCHDPTYCHVCLLRDHQVSRLPARRIVLWTSAYT
jgi:hypothetical protein